MRITVNTVDHLCDEFDFKIVTRDRDWGDNKPYTNIKINQWQKVGNAMVCYLTPQSSTLKSISELIDNTPHHILYLNSFFDPLTIKVLFNRKIHGLSSIPVIVSPWGDFGWASLKQKYPKKFVFIQLAKLFGLYKGVIWRASSELEKSDIIKVMKPKSMAIHITKDFPIKNAPDVFLEKSFTSPSHDEYLKVIFLSRISREKNLDYALKVLKKVNARVVFDIYGPAENETYWEECCQLIDQLPANVIVNYLGSIDPDQVVSVFSRYDLFLFPTGGEAYGHVIAECLTAGTPVLISTETQWRNLQSDGLGWDVDLARMDNFVEIIENMSLLGKKELQDKRSIVKANIINRLLDPVILETNRQLFCKALRH